MAKVVETPLMKQYFDIKAKHPDAILYSGLRLYEMYGEDAVIGAEILGIVQTKRANGVAQHVEMADFHIMPWILICRSWCGPESVWLFATSWKTLS